MWLTDTNWDTIIMPTNCKTWRCVPCQNRMMSLFTMRVETGVSALGQCVFITITYRLGSGPVRDAVSVNADWKELWRRLRAQNVPVGKMKWLRVIETTKRGQPHIHMIAGPVKGRVRCYGVDGIHPSNFLDRMESCPCLAHQVSRVWFEITKDSYIVDAVPVLGAPGAGRYLAKYMQKGALNRRKLDDLGFTRRWSSSRGWPGSGRLRLAQTDIGWLKRSYAPQSSPKESIITNRGEILPAEGHRLSDRTGSDLAIALSEKRKLKRAKKYVLGKVHIEHQNVSSENITNRGDERGRQDHVRNLTPGR